MVGPPGGGPGPGLAVQMGGDDINRARTGIPLDAGAVAAKLAWLAEHQPERLQAAHVLLSPRDFVVYRMTDQLVTDATFASRSGLYDFDGNAGASWPGRPWASSPASSRPTPSWASSSRFRRPNSVCGPGMPVVIGAGDRQCEVLGTGTSAPPHGELGHHRRCGAGAGTAGAIPAVRW